MSDFKDINKLKKQIEDIEKPYHLAAETYGKARKDGDKWFAKDITETTFTIVKQRFSQYYGDDTYGNEDSFTEYKTPIELLFNVQGLKDKALADKEEESQNSLIQYRVYVPHILKSNFERNDGLKRLKELILDPSLNVDYTINVEKDTKGWNLTMRFKRKELNLIKHQIRDENFVLFTYYKLLTFAKSMSLI